MWVRLPVYICIRVFVSRDRVTSAASAPELTFFLCPYGYRVTAPEQLVLGQRVTRNRFVRVRRHMFGTLLLRDFVKYPATIHRQGMYVVYFP